MANPSGNLTSVPAFGVQRLHRTRNRLHTTVVSALPSACLVHALSIQSLFKHPKPDNPVNYTSARLYMEDRVNYNKRVRQCVARSVKESRVRSKIQNFGNPVPNLRLLCFEIEVGRSQQQYISGLSALGSFSKHCSDSKMSRLC